MGEHPRAAHPTALSQGTDRRQAFARKRWKQGSKSFSNGAYGAQGQRHAGACYGVQHCMGRVGRRSKALLERLLIN